MQPITALFDNLARAITSMGLVTIVFLMYITGMIACSHALFLRVFPETMIDWQKDLAAWTISLAWEFTVLVTITNPKHINERIPWFVSIASGVITLFFVEAFDFTQPPLIVAQRWFIGVLVAGIGYIYAHLFYKRWADHTDALAMPQLLATLQAEVAQLRAALAQRDADLADRDRQLADVRAELKEAKAIVKEYALIKTKQLKDRTCPWCELELDTPASMNSHKRHCKKKPA